MKAFAILGGAVAAAAGLLASVLVQVVGDLPVAEIFLAVLLPALIIMGGRQMIRPSIRPVLMMMGLWLAGQIMTDIYRQTALFDWLRGDANIIVFGIDVLALVALLGKSDSRKVAFVLGYSIGHILAAKYKPTHEVDLDSWKFGYAPAIILLVLLASSGFYRRRNYAMTVLLVVGIAVVNILMNFRSAALSLIITIAVTVPLIPERVGRLQLLPPPKSTARAMVLAALAVGAGGVALAAVDIATMSGILGHQAQVKNENQARSPGGMLLGGRPEVLVSTRAIIDSPLLGHGSWARDPKYTEMLLDTESHYGMQAPADYSEERRWGLIPAHSMILGSWVSAGVLGGVFWIFVIKRVVKGIAGVSTSKEALAPLYAYLLVDLFWAILFSPLGSPNRLIVALAIVVMADSLETGVPARKAVNLRRTRPSFQQPGRLRPSFK
jgi:hypothetical protein